MTIQQIQKNQQQFKEEILSWLKSDFSNTKKILKSIECKDAFIIKEKKKLQKRTKKLDYMKKAEKLFFLDCGATVFAIWSEENRDVIIIT